MNRRELLARAGLAAGAAAGADAGTGGSTRGTEGSPRRGRLAGEPDWATVRAQFDLAPGLVQMAGFYLASHPAPVRAAIERHRRGLDADPYGYYQDHNARLVGATLRAAGEYLGADPAEIALTGSTTMGLALLYGGLRLEAGQEILTTTHDHYATAETLRLRAARTGATVRQVALYDDPAAASAAEMAARLLGAVGPRTRVVAVTWVHSGTGVKLPLRALADGLAEVNAGRDEGERALLCVDGVHGLGVEDAGPAELGCDFLVAGCHKWLGGPRGTGLVWGRPAVWPLVAPTVPSFDAAVWAGLAGGDVPPAGLVTPGGFHAFEHRWALAEAFRVHLGLGRAAVTARLHGLASGLKDGLAAVPGVVPRTPRAEEVSAGIVCFEVAGQAPEATVAGLRERGVVASVTPYATRYARLGPGVFTSEEDIEATVRAVRDLV